jgi:exonuclease SbcC
MIAQGEFLKLLLAKTEERSEIFRRIFDTKLYQIFQDRIRAEVNQLASTHRDLNRDYDYSFGGVSVDEEDNDGLDMLTAIKNGTLLPDDAILWLAECIHLDNDLIDSNTKILTEIAAELSLINQKLGKTEQDKKLREALEGAQARLPKEIDALNQAQATLDLEKARKPEYESIQAQIIEIESALPKYEQLQALANKIKITEVELVKVNEQIQEFEEGQDEYKKTLDNAKKELLSLADTEVAIESLQNKKQALQERQASLSAFYKSKKEHETLLTLKEKAKSDYRTASEKSQRLRAEYECMHKTYLDEQAGFLADHLKPGMPCPVCGSKEHPTPAALSASAPTKAVLAKAKQAVETAEKESQAASENSNNLIGQEAAKKNELASAAGILFGEIDYDEIITIFNNEAKKVKEELASIDKQIVAAKTNLQRKEELSKDILNYEKIIEGFIADISKARESIAVLKTQLTADRENYNKQTAELKYENIAKANAQLVVLRKSKKAMEESLQKAQAAFDAATLTVSATKSEMDALTLQVKEVEVIDLDALLTKKETIDSKQKLVTAQNQKIAARQMTNEAAYKNIVQVIDELRVVQEKYKWLKSLSDTANGDVTGKDKIKLETYIQTAYFEKIISRANIRFMQMSGAQYELKRRGAGSRQSQSGLDLDVIDHYNDTERDVKTLSGGESFLASLSLALGLSDEIQSYAGGIKLDSMFIDEGFGSLDENTLSQAMKALMGISQNNRLIGIISHVTELNEKIDRKIVVTKRRTGGSMAEIVV